MEGQSCFSMGRVALLFNKLPDEIFKPLAGPNRHLFEEILLAMFHYFSDEELTNQAVFPRRSHIIREIEELLERKDRLLQLVDEEGSSGEDFSNAPGPAARYIYNRLVSTGWLEEEEDGYHVNVLMPPHASLLLEALVGVANSEKKNYGSTVASIYLQLEAIVNHPKDNARAFIEVVRAARDFTRHLQNIFSGLRGFQEQITRQRDARLALVTFFDDFVENLLISDYKSLQAENNPFRHRDKILRLLVEIEHLDTPIDALVQVYQEDKKLAPSLARQRVLNDLHFIARVFHSVDDRLGAIDLYCRRLESRVAEMVRYIDRNIPDMTTRGIKLLELLGQLSQDSPEGELPDLPQPSRWLSSSLLGPLSIRQPQKRRQPQTIKLAAPKEISPEAKERKRLMSLYLERRSVSPTIVANYIDRQMGERTSMSAKDFTIETIEDLMAFVFTPYLSHMKGRPMANMPSFTIRRTGGRIETPYMECSDFIVERRR